MLRFHSTLYSGIIDEKPSLHSSLCTYFVLVIIDIITPPVAPLIWEFFFFFFFIQLFRLDPYICVVMTQRAHLCRSIPIDPWFSPAMLPELGLLMLPADVALFGLLYLGQGNYAGSCANLFLHVLVEYHNTCLFRLYVG